MLKMLCFVFSLMPIVWEADGFSASIIVGVIRYRSFSIITSFRRFLVTWRQTPIWTGSSNTDRYSDRYSKFSELCMFRGFPCIVLSMLCLVAFLLCICLWYLLKHIIGYWFGYWYWLFFAYWKGEINCISSNSELLHLDLSLFTISTL